MNRERAKELLPIIEHWVNGGEIEGRPKGTPGWSNLTTGANFYADWIYRIKQTPDSIDWSHVHESINAIARDADGGVFAYSSEPGIADNSDEWLPKSVAKVISPDVARLIASYKRGTVTWDNSLITRPEAE